VSRKPPEQPTWASAHPWLQAGANGLLFAVAAFTVPFLLRKQLANDPTGNKGDPLAPAKQSPDPKAYVPPHEAKITPATTRTVWVRRLAAADPHAGARGVAILQAHTLVVGGVRVTDRTRVETIPVTSNNLLHRDASRTYGGHWTVVAAEEWKWPRPVYRWRPIRAYASLDEAAADWLSDLPPEAREGLRVGDPVMYWRAVGSGPYEAELVALYKVQMQPALVMPSRVGLRH